MVKMARKIERSAPLKPKKEGKKGDNQMVE